MRGDFCFNKFLSYLADHYWGWGLDFLIYESNRFHELLVWLLVSYLLVYIRVIKILLSKCFTKIATDFFRFIFITCEGF